MLKAIGTAVFSGSFALSIGIGARSCYRIGSWLAGTGLALVSALLALWSFAELYRLAEGADHGKLAPQLLALLLFGVGAFLFGHGARQAFQRHRWVFGTLFLLAAIFTFLCTIFTVLDVIKALR